MQADSPRWHPGGPAATPAEQHALDQLRALLPEAPTTFAWPNVTFIDEQGRLSEVDVVLLHRSGLFLLELKGWHGEIRGTQQEWRIVRPNRADELVPNPLFATDRKAKRLQSLLKRTLAKAAKGQHLPFIQAITVLHGEGSQVKLDDLARAHTYALDGAGVTGLPRLSEFLNAPATDQRNAVDGTRAKALRALIGAAGLQASPRVRKVGQYRIENREPIAEGPGWVDVRAAHPTLPGQFRRIRLYDVAPQASPAQRQQVERQAQREYLLTSGLAHPGVVAARDYFDDPEAGPAVVFDDDAHSTPFERWLEGQRDSLTFETRLALLRQVGEVLRYAHSRGIHHRALTPTQIHVVEKPGQPVLVTVRDWQTGGLDPDAASRTLAAASVWATSGGADYLSHDNAVYLAPEAWGAHPYGAPLDVFSLGTLACLLLTDLPPAMNLAELQERLSAGGLDPSVELEGLPDELCDVVRRATHPDLLERTPDVDTFLSELSDAERVPRHDIESRDVDPHEAQVGDILDDTWLVEERLGSGSTGVALAITDGNAASVVRVLKVAHDPACADRLLAEAELLARLDHPRVVRLIDSPLEMAGRTCLLLEDAGRPTLAQQLREFGKLTLERLASFGEDLLGIATYLDSQGVLHRDLKPDNLGVRPDPGDRRPRLVLFDFSLAHAAVDDLRSGTQPYLDPFLGPPGRPRYDTAAERFALAVTLFELASGRRPEWGDGASHPAAIHDEVTLSPGMFDEPVADGLVGFFRRALARDTSKRFGDLPELAESWRAVFRGLEAPGQVDEQAEAARDEAAAAATLATPIAAAGLTARAVSALTRLEVVTVDDLLSTPAMSINQMPGIGVHTRSEIQRRRRQWATALGSTTTVVEEPSLAGRGAEEILHQLLPKGGNRPELASLAKAVLTLDPGFHVLPPWPTWAQAATAAALPDTDGANKVVSLWSKREGAQDLRKEVRGLVATLGGIASVDEVASALLATHGSTADGPARRRAGLALVRVAVEIGSQLDDPDDGVLEFARGRDDDSPGLMALDAPGVSAVQRIEAARRLAETADAAVVERALLGGAESTLVVRESANSEAVAIGDPGRLLRLSAAASKTAAVSAHGELYRRGLGAPDSLLAVLSGAAASVVAEERLRRKVAARFPDAAALPARPQLDDLVRAAAPLLQWDGTAYRRPTHSQTRLHTSTSSTVVGDLRVADEQMLTRLETSLSTHAALILGVDPRRVDATAGALTQRYDVERVDVTSRLLRELRLLASDKGVQWSFLLGVDALPEDSRDRATLNSFVRLAVERFWPEVTEHEGPLLLTDIAPLFRYDFVQPIAELVDLATTRRGTRWVLVPHRSSDGPPTLEGRHVPLPASGWLDLPKALAQQSSIGAPQ